ncbi:glycosyltransferase [Candidatus Woesearchaeota archaeon]|nr:glycosyltransferase [Candidatus Woesearchaeota archaeon]
MIIYYASQSFYPHIGGVSTYLLNLESEMVLRDNKVVEVHLRPPKAETEDEIRGIQVRRVPRERIRKEIMRKYSAFKETIYTACHYPLALKEGACHEIDGFREFNLVNEYFGEELKALLDEDDADIVHIHDFQLLFTYRYVPRGTPLILTWHIPFHDGIPDLIKEFLITNFMEYDRIIFSHPDYIASAVRAGLPEEKCELIYPIANTRLFRKAEVDRTSTLSKHSIPDGRLILSVQRIDPKSGHEQLIRAMPKVLEKVPDAKLIFIGASSLSNRLSKSREALAKEVHALVDELGLQDRVIFAGNIEYTGLWEVYNCADVVALCSKNEGFGLSITEAMACGRAVLGTRVGGIPLQIAQGKNGYLIERGDIDATAAHLVRILSDDTLRERMEQASLERVENEFRMELGIEKHLALYSGVINTKDEFHKLKYYDISEFRALITDFDRTITDGPHPPDLDRSRLDRDLLRRLERLGLQLFLSTGRPFAFARKLARAFPHWTCIMAENGAVLYFPRTKKTITLDSYHMRQARRRVRAIGIDGTTIGTVYVSVPLGEHTRVMEELIDLADMLSFTVNVDELLILPKNVDKGVGIRLVMRYLQIDLEKTIIIGDGENDVDMYLNPGFKIALANSHPRLKELADEIMDRSSTAGMREFLDRLAPKDAPKG